MPNIRENPHIRLTHLSLFDLTHVIVKSRAPNRPVANISFALNYYIHRYNVVGYHLVNILIHLTCGLLLYLLVKSTLRISWPDASSKYRQWIPFFTALLWMVHPLQTQSISYIVQRMNSMAAMFYILSLLLFIKFRIANVPKKKWILLGGCILSGFLALGTKENAATLPFFIFLYEWFFFQKLSIHWLKRHAFTLTAIVITFALVAGLYIGINQLEKIDLGYSLRDFTVSQRLLTELRVVIFYVSLLFWPQPSRLNLDHDFSLSHSLFQPPATAICLVIILASIILAIYFARRDRLSSFCVIWFLGNLVIESSVIGLELVFEHRTYLPSMLAILLAVVVVLRVIKLQWLGIGILCMAAVLGSIWTFQRNQVWTDEIALWRDCVKKSPQKARAYNNLALALAGKGNFNDAITNYRVALKLKPDYARAHYNLGVILAKQGNLNKGIHHLRTAVQIDPNNSEAQNNLGVALLIQGHLDAAIVHLKNALKITPYYAEAHNNLGKAMQLKGNLPMAIEHYQAAVHLDPDYAKAHTNLGIILKQMGRLEEAQQHLEKALRLRPGYEEARRNLKEIVNITDK
jgi:tetratricopeptide (TPR) repeat protein